MAQPKQTKFSSDLRESEEQFAQLVAGVRDYAIFLLNAQGLVLTWNAGIEKIKGYKADEIIGQHFSVFYPPEAISTGWPAHELKVASETGRFEDDGWRVRKDGSKFWANVVITALRDEAGGVRGFLKLTRDLTDRKQAEEKFRVSEERFRLIVEGVRDYAIFMIDPAGRVATWNTGAERLKGYTADEIIGQHFSRFYPQEAIDRGWPEEELRRATTEGRIEDEGWRLRKDGWRFWANVVITALFDDAGRLQGFAKVTRDLTERRKAEERTRRLLQETAAPREAIAESAREIEQQREQLRVTLSSIGDAVIVTDRESRVTFMNPVAVELTGWEITDAVGQPLERVFVIVNERTRQTVENPASRVLSEGTIVGLANHTILVSRDGREIPIDDSGAPIRGVDGEIAGVVLVFRDVSETRRAVEARLHLAAIVESSDDAIISKNLDGIITSWNRGAERLYGYSPEEILGRPLAMLVPPDHQDELPEIIERIKRGERIEHFETQRVRKDGSIVEVSLTVSPIRNAEGEIVGASKIARDITARKEEDRHKNEFLAMLAHELRNPLAPIRSGVQVLRLAGGDREAVEEAAEMMERQVQHLVRLVDDLLDLSRISQGKLRLQKKRTELHGLIDYVLGICGQLCKDHQLIVKLPEERVPLDVDKTRMGQTICNLLGNAAKYSDPGGRIWLTAARTDGSVTISVKDEGIGIAPPMLSKVFDLFMQVDRSLEKSQAGLGIGLTIVKRLVEMHNGTVEARSPGIGKGSEFIVGLPIATAATPGARAANPKAAPSASRKRILVVDDNVDGARTLAMMLRIAGNDTTLAHDGLEAIEKAAAIQPEIILLDIGMPGLNGYDTCRRIREQPWGRSITIVALTGWGQEEDRRRSLEAGFDSHLIKPVELAVLNQLLAKLRGS